MASDLSISNGEMVGLAGKADARFRGVPKAASGQKVTTTVAASYSLAIPAGSHVMLTATQAMFIRMSTSGSGQDAAPDVDMYILPGIPYMVKMGSDASNVAYTFISAIRSTVDGLLYIMPMSAD